MSGNKIYLIKFEDDKVNNSDDLDHPVFEEISKILNKSDLKCIGVSNNEDIFLKLSDSKVEKVTNVLRKYYKIQIIDISEEVKSGYIQSIYPEVEFLTPKLFKNFRLENTSKDDVLDKITCCGLNSLDKIDKKILKK